MRDVPPVLGRLAFGALDPAGAQSVVGVLTETLTWIGPIKPGGTHAEEVVSDPP